jgi:hypothetical protein
MRILYGHELDLKQLAIMPKVYQSVASFKPWFLATDQRTL